MYLIHSYFFYILALYIFISTYNSYKKQTIYLKLIICWAPNPSKVPLAKCTVESDPENIRFWMKRLNAFCHSHQLLHSKNVGSIYRKKYTLFSKCNRSPFKTRYQTNCQPLITAFILYWLLLNEWKCYPRANHTLERNMTRALPEILHFGELYYTRFLFWKVHWAS